MQPSAVAEAACAHLHESVYRVEPVRGFAANDDYLIGTSAGDYILKASEPAPVAAEAWACERARAAGVAAPQIIAVDLSQSLLPRAFLLERHVGGQPADPGDHALIAAAGRQLRALHEIAGAGFGFLAGSTELPHGPAVDWRAVLMAPLAAGGAVARADVVPAEWVDRLRALVAEGLRRRPVHSGVLLHGDSDPRHVFGQDGRLTGIIDWGDALIGDPVFDLARFTRTRPDAVDALLAGYGITDDAELRAMIALYRAVWTLIDLGIDLTGGSTEWLPAHLQVLDETLHALADW